MDQVVAYLVVGGLIALSVWARIRFFKPRDARELPQPGAVDLSAFGASGEPPSASGETPPRPE